jgi:hypothetical protein
LDASSQYLCDEGFATFIKLIGVWQEETRPGERLLKLLFGSILVFMLINTVRTCLPVSLWSAMPWFAANPRATATLYNTFGFSTFFSRLAWQERSPGAKLMWFG